MEMKDNKMTGFALAFLRNENDAKFAIKTLNKQTMLEKTVEVYNPTKDWADLASF